MNKVQEINKLCEELKKILLIFKKNPNRYFKPEYILNKQTIVKNIYQKYTSFYHAIVDILPKETVNTQKEIFFKIYNELQLKLHNYSQAILEKSTLTDEESEEESENKFEKNIKMASFDIVSTYKLVPEFEGNHKKLENFLNLVEYIHDTLKDDNEKNKLIEFVIKTKLAEKVRIKLNSCETPKTFANLKKLFKEIFKVNTTTLKIHTDLTKVRQAHLSITNFATKIENLTSELNSLQITEQGEESRDIIGKLNGQIALNTFKNGLNEPTKSTIFASRPKTLQEAVQLATEIEQPINSANIYHYDSRNRRQYGYVNNNFRNTNRNWQNRRTPQINNNYNNNNKRFGNRNNNFNSRYGNNYSNMNNNNKRYGNNYSYRNNTNNKNNTYENRNYISRNNYNRNNQRQNHKYVNYINQSGNVEAVPETQ